MNPLIIFRLEDSIVDVNRYHHTMEFILFIVKTTADNVIEQLLQTNNIQKQQSIASWLSPFVEDIPVKQNFNRQEILGLLILNNYF